MSDRKKLVCIDLRTGDQVYSRTLHTDYIPTSTDLDFYYKDLCGFTDAVVTLQMFDIPPDFNGALLSFSEQIPTRYPNYDIATPVADTEKLTKYHQYIAQLSGMERARAALNVHMTEPVVAEPARGANSEPAPRRYHLKKHDWVKEILETLESDDVPPTGDELVPVEEDDHIPHAWILTPVVASVRSAKGSRILMNAVKGKHWERMLGSSLFPDFVVSRRISTRTWMFQHETADDLLRATLRFYIASQNGVLVDGLTGWIPSADKEIGLLVNTFKRIKIHETVMRQNVADPNHMYSLLNMIELRCLDSRLTTPSIYPIPFGMFEKYVHYVAKARQIPPENYTNVEGVTQMLRRWERAELGFRPDADPVIEQWTTMWNLVIRAVPSVDRVLLFLRTLDAWNPIEASVMTTAMRYEIATQWINIFIDTELILEAGAQEKAVVLYDVTKCWCLQYLPIDLFETCFRLEKVAPEYTKRGFKKTKPYVDRIINGVRFRTPPNKVAVGGKAVNKEDAPQPKIKPKQVREYVPAHPATISAAGKRLGRPPKAKTPEGGTLTMASTSTEDDDDDASQESRGILDMMQGGNELVMNLGSL